MSTKIFLALPFNITLGLPLFKFIISMSFQYTPLPKPVPSAFDTAFDPAHCCLTIVGDLA